MAYNIPDSYSEQAPAEQLDKKDLEQYGLAVLISTSLFQL